MKFGFNVKGVDPSKARQGGGKQAPVGMYTAKITGCVVAKPEGKDERLEIVYNIQDPKVNYAPLYDYISLESESVQWKLDQFLQAMGVTTDTKREGNADTDKFVGQVVKLRVRADSYQGEYKAKPEGIWKLQPGEEVGESSEGGVTWDDISAMTEDELNADQSLLDLVTEKAEAAGIDPDEYDEWTDVVSAINEGGAPEETPEDEPEDEPEGEETTDEVDDDWAAILEMEEEDAEINAEAISAYAEQYGIDPDDYDLWTEVVAAIAEAMENGGGEDGETPDYESMTLADLKALCEERDLATGGTKTALIKRLQAADELDDGPGLPD